MRVIFYNHPLPGIDSLSGRTKGFGEEGEQLVSLVCKKEKQKQPLYDPFLPIRVRPKGARNEAGAVRESRTLGCKAPGPADCLCWRDLLVTIPGAVMDGEGKDIKDDEVECRDLFCT